jgi:D-alanyl-D-alanine dipeptidase
MSLASLLAAVALAAAPAPLVDVAEAIPDAVVQLRYAGEDNFVGRRLYPPRARCLLRQPAVERLAEAARALRGQGFRLLLYDCYRPPSLQQRMWEAFPRPGYVADPARGGSVHSRGGAVDVGLVALDGSAVPLPTPHDFFGRAAWHGAPGTPPEAARNRERLLAALEAAGFKRNRMEWWHYEVLGSGRWPRVEAPLELPAR